MTRDKVHDLMENELRCVQRASVNACDRNCKECQLLEDTGDIVTAYGIVIQMLEQNPIKDFVNDLNDIYSAIWDVDIPSPTVPEYIEHHEQMVELMELVKKKIRKYDGM